MKKTKMYMVEVIYKKHENKCRLPEEDKVCCCVEEVCELIRHQPFTSLKIAHNMKKKMESRGYKAKYRVVEVSWKSLNKKHDGVMALWEL